MKVALVVWIAWILTVAAVGSAEGVESRFVDERGEPIVGALRVCRTVALEQTCDDVVLDGEPLTLDRFEVLQVSGPGHGPARFDSRSEEDTYTVPRKAYLTVTELGSQAGLSASLYATDSPGFRRPFERVEVRGETVRIPAGSWVLSLSDGESAPDLHLLTARPAERLAVPWRQTAGWSVVVRVVGEDPHEALSGAQVEVTATPGYGELKTRAAETGPPGLATFSGLEVGLADVTVTHESFLPAKSTAVSASAGSFAVREVTLERGAVVAGTVTLDGEPSHGARWVMSEPGRADVAGWAELETGETNEEGRFLTGPLPAGLLSLRVTPSPDAEASAGSAIVDVRAESGETREVAVELVRRVVEGEVRIDGEPAADFGVSIASAMTGSATDQMWVAATEVGENGEYELVVWEEGEHTLTVVDRERRFVETERVWVGRDGASLDFDLRLQRLEGRVVDREGRPLPEARVHARWNRRLFVVPVDEEGRFSVALNGSGTAEIGGFHEGYAEPAPVVVEVAEGSVPAPVILRFDTLEGWGGRVTAQGRPAAGVRVSAFSMEGERPRALGGAASDATGSFRMTGQVRGPVSLFLTGPGCPLTLVEVVVGEEPLDVECSPASGNLVVHLESEQGEPGAGVALSIAYSGVGVPGDVLAAHLGGLGLAARTNSAGEIVLAALQPGRWEVFLAQQSNAATIRTGRAFGFLTAADIGPGQTVEMEVVANF